MKKIKRKVAAFLIFAMIMAMSVPAFAGTITIRNATPSDKGYVAYKVFDLTYAVDAEGKPTGEVAYTYTTTDKQPKGTTTDALYKYLSATDSPFELEETVDPAVFNVILKTDGSGVKKTAQEIATYLGAKVDLLGTGKSNGDISGGKTTIEGLDAGYYFVTSGLGSTVTIDSTIPDVMIIDKNQQPGWNTPSEPDKPYNPGDGNGKYIKEGDEYKLVNSVNYGETVNFSIFVRATSYANPLVTDENDPNVGLPAKDEDGNLLEPKLVSNYVIKDTLADGFDPATNIVVKVNKSDNSTVTLIEDVDYKLTPSGNRFEIMVPFGEKYGSNAIIEVDYSAKVNKEHIVVIGENGNLNTANFTYITNDDFDPDHPYDDPDDPEDPDPSKHPTPSDAPKPYSESKKKTTTTYVYALAIQKTDDDGRNLKGAKFSVKTEVDGTEYYLIAGEPDSSGVYSYIGKKTEKGEDTIFTPVESGDNIGRLVIKGIKGEEEGTDYIFTEEVAPVGYNKLVTPVTVKATLTESYDNTTIATMYYDADGKLVDEKVEGGSEVTYSAEVPVFGIAIKNQKGTELPATGGAGTTLMIALGSLLFMGTAVVLVSKKRLYNESR